MEREEIASNYLQWFNNNYDYLKKKMVGYTTDRGVAFDEDVFSDTMLKMYEKILKSGLVDPITKGMENYFFISFKTNVLREKQYSRNIRKDDNLNDELENLYEEWYNATMRTPEEKVKKDLWTDYATIYLMDVVEKNFDEEHSYLFRMKTFMPKMTYSKLAKMTGKKNVRQKVVDVKNYLRDNVNKDDVIKQFFEKYGNLL